MAHNAYILLHFIFFWRHYVTFKQWKMFNSLMHVISCFIAFDFKCNCRKMETVGSSETNLLSGKSDRKKTSLSSRSKSRQLRRSHAAVDNDDYNVANIHSASSLGVSVLLRMPSVCFIRTAVQREVEKIRQKTDKQTDWLKKWRPSDY